MLRAFTDTDSYKPYMQQFILEHYPDVNVRYKFINRRPAGDFTPEFLAKLREHITNMEYVHLTDDEYKFMQKQPEFKIWYLEYLKNYRFDSSELTFDLVDGNLELEINGPWHRTVLWEVPLMAMISEAYFEDKTTTSMITNNLASLEQKAKDMGDLHFCEFGTRRRRSYEFQRDAIKILSQKKNFLGTSNLHFARIFGLKNLGTQAHEIYQGTSAIEGINRANYHTMRRWYETYKGRLNIALTDTFGTNMFLKDFNHEWAHTLDGVRQDSGDPIQYGFTMLHHYHNLGINPEYKKILFSDNLNPAKCQNIDSVLGKHINKWFCIGTNFTNSVPESPSLNMVIKLHEVNGIPVCKLSDDPDGKASGDPRMVQIAKEIASYYEPH